MKGRAMVKGDCSKARKSKMEIVSIPEREGETKPLRRQLKCSLAGFQRLVTAAKNLECMTIDHFSLISQSPFSSLFWGLYDNKLNKNQLKRFDSDLWKLIECYKEDTESFEFGDTSLKLTTADVKKVFGLEIQSCPDFDAFPETSADREKEFWEKYFPGKNDLFALDIYEAFLSAIKINDATVAQDSICLMIMYLCATLFYPLTNSKLPRHVAKKCLDLDAVNRFNWAEDILEFLNKQLKQKGQSINGCVLLVLYWFCDIANIIQPIKGTSEEDASFLKWNVGEVHLKMESDSVRAIMNAIVPETTEIALLKSENHKLKEQVEELKQQVESLNKIVEQQQQENEKLKSFDHQKKDGTNDVSVDRQEEEQELRETKSDNTVAFEQQPEQESEKVSVESDGVEKKDGNEDDHVEQREQKIAKDGEKEVPSRIKNIKARTDRKKKEIDAVPINFLPLDVPPKDKGRKKVIDVEESHPKEKKRKQDLLGGALKRSKIWNTLTEDDRNKLAAFWDNTSEGDSLWENDGDSVGVYEVKDLLKSDMTSTNVINSYLFIISKEEEHKTSLFVSSLAWECVSRGDDDGIKEQLFMPLFSNWGKVQKIFFPIHIDEDKHFVLLVVDKENATSTLYDSLKASVTSKSYSAATKMHHAVQSALNYMHVKGAGWVKENQMTYHTSKGKEKSTKLTESMLASLSVSDVQLTLVIGKCLVQPGRSLDCGIVVILIAESLSKGFTLPVSLSPENFKILMAQMRRSIVHAFLNDEWSWSLGDIKTDARVDPIFADLATQLPKKRLRKI